VAEIFHLKEPVKAPLVLSKDVADSGSNSDNALAETINGLYKAEVIHRLGPWKCMRSQTPVDALSVSLSQQGQSVIILALTS
jgi:hypothetical protein